MLGGAGARVTSAESAAEAWGHLAGGLFDVLVCDIAMPGEDGFAFIARVRALDATEGGEIPALALTAHARVEERTRCLEAGFQRHLSKPVDVAELRHAVRELAGRPIV
jgi:CheY-like chemotaxis protein